MDKQRVVQVRACWCAAFGCCGCRLRAAWLRSRQPPRRAAVAACCCLDLAASLSVAAYGPWCWLHGGAGPRPTRRGGRRAGPRAEDAQRSGSRRPCLSVDMNASGSRRLCRLARGQLEARGRSRPLASQRPRVAAASGAARPPALRGMPADSAALPRAPLTRRVCARRAWQGWNDFLASSHSVSPRPLPHPPILPLAAVERRGDAEWWMQSGGCRLMQEGLMQRREELRMNNEPAAVGWGGLKPARGTRQARPYGTACPCGPCHGPAAATAVPHRGRVRLESRRAPG